MTNVTGGKRHCLYAFRVMIKEDLFFISSGSISFRPKTAGCRYSISDRFEQRIYYANEFTAYMSFRPARANASRYTRNGSRGVDARARSGRFRPRPRPAGMSSYQSFYHTAHAPYRRTVRSYGVFTRGTTSRTLFCCLIKRTAVVNSRRNTRARAPFQLSHAGVRPNIRRSRIVPKVRRIVKSELNPRDKRETPAESTIRTTRPDNKNRSERTSEV